MPDLNSLVTSKLAFGVLIGSILATGGLATAAFAGVLPDPMQQTAHLLIGAPESRIGSADAFSDDEPDADGTEGNDPGAEGPEAEGTEADGTDADGMDADGTGAGRAGDGGGTGPVITGSAASGLCTAYTNGGLAENSTAYRAFDEVEGGIDAYCATVIRDKSDKSDKSDNRDKPRKSEKVSGPDGSVDTGDDEQLEEAGADAPDVAPTGAPGEVAVDGTSGAPAGAPATKTPDRSTTAPESVKPSREVPPRTNGGGQGTDAVKDR